MKNWGKALKMQYVRGIVYKSWQNRWDSNLKLNVRVYCESDIPLIL